MHIIQFTLFVHWSALASPPKNHYNENIKNMHAFMVGTMLGDEAAVSKKLAWHSFAHKPIIFFNNVNVGKSNYCVLNI